MNINKICFKKILNYKINIFFLFWYIYIILLNHSINIYNKHLIKVLIIDLMNLTRNYLKLFIKQLITIFIQKIIVIGKSNILKRLLNDLTYTLIDEVNGEN